MEAELIRERPAAGALPGWSAARALPPRRAALQRAAGALLARAELLFVVVSLFLFSQALVPLILEGNAPYVEGAYVGNAVLRAMFVSIHAVTLLLLLVHWRAGLAAALRTPSSLLLVGLAVASVAWSAAPDITLRRSFAFLGTTAFGIYLAARWDTRSQLRLLAAALGVAAVMSFALAVALPGWGRDQVVHVGAWQGIYTEKNTLGQMMVVGTVVFVLLRRLARRRWVATAGAGLSAALVLLSTAGTALAVLVALGLLTLLLRALRLSVTLAVPLAIGFVLVGGSAAAWMAENLDVVLTAMGKDPTLTGRTSMWEVIVASIADRPVLGHGYAAFWLGREGPSAEALEAIGWDTPGAHNGYLDLALQVGGVGLLVFLAGLAAAGARALRTVRATRTADGLWPALFLAFLVMYNFTETMLLSANSIFWVLYVAVSASRPEPEVAR